MESRTNPPALILASASPRRRELLTILGVRFEVTPSTLPEPEDKPAAMSSAEWAIWLAEFKANAVAECHPTAWVLGADTLVVCGEEILNKPRDRAEARRMLELQAGVETHVITGVCLLAPAGTPDRHADRAAPPRALESRCSTRSQSAERSACVEKWAETTRVWMRDAPHVRAVYLESGDWEGKAGAYGIQTVGDELVERIDGSFSNVVGLPVERVGEMLRRRGLLNVAANVDIA